MFLKEGYYSRVLAVHGSSVFERNVFEIMFHLLHVARDATTTGRCANWVYAVCTGTNFVVSKCALLRLSSF